MGRIGIALDRQRPVPAEHGEIEPEPSGLSPGNRELAQGGDVRAAQGGSHQRLQRRGGEHAEEIAGRVQLSEGRVGKSDPPRRVVPDRDGEPQEAAHVVAEVPLGRAGVVGLAGQEVDAPDGPAARHRRQVPDAPPGPAE